jgi:hypothetical protein
LILSRATNFWFLVLLFQGKGQFRLILLLLLLKPPRLAKARTEMMPKFLEKIAALLRRLPLLTLKSKVWRRKGSVLTNRFPRVPPFQRMRQESQLLPSPLILRCLMLWTREFTSYYYSIFFDPLLFSFLLMSNDLFLVTMII